MNNKQSDENLFKKLEKVFGFSKKNEQIFVPKELAQQIIPETESTSTLEIDQQPKEMLITRKKREKTLVSPVKTQRNIFDLTDISDVDPKVKLKIKPINESLKDFSSRIFNLFDIAKKNGIETLNFDQITAAYYKVYTMNNKAELKTRPQIAAKVYNMEYVKKKNVRNAHLIKVADKDSTYSVSDY